MVGFADMLEIDSSASFLAPDYLPSTPNAIEIGDSPTATVVPIPEPDTSGDMDLLSVTLESARSRALTISDRTFYVYSRHTAFLVSRGNHSIAQVLSLSGVDSYGRSCLSFLGGGESQTNFIFAIERGSTSMSNIVAFEVVNASLRMAHFTFILHYPVEE
jgi:hypothetical protein